MGLWAGIFKTAGIPKAGMKSIGHSIGKGIAMARGGYREVRRLAGIAGHELMGPGRFYGQHAKAIWGLGLGGIGMGYALSQGSEVYRDSPTMRGANVRTNYDQQALAAAEMMEGWVAPTPGIRIGTAMGSPGMNNEFAQSTYGLVQGLNSRRTS